MGFQRVANDCPEVGLERSQILGGLRREHDLKIHYG